MGTYSYFNDTMGDKEYLSSLSDAFRDSTVEGEKSGIEGTEYIKVSSELAKIISTRLMEISNKITEKQCQTNRMETHL